MRGGMDGTLFHQELQKRSDIGEIWVNGAVVATWNRLGTGRAGCSWPTRVGAFSWPVYNHDFVSG